MRDQPTPSWRSLIWHPAHLQRRDGGDGARAVAVFPKPRQGMDETAARALRRCLAQERRCASPRPSAAHASSFAGCPVEIYIVGIVSSTGGPRGLGPCLPLPLSDRHCSSTPHPPRRRRSPRG